MMSRLCPKPFTNSGQGDIIVSNLAKEKAGKDAGNLRRRLSSKTPSQTVCASCVWTQSESER